MPREAEACIAKLVASGAVVSVASDAMQIFGVDYLMEAPVQRYLRDAYLLPGQRGHDGDPAAHDRPPGRHRVDGGS